MNLSDETAVIMTKAEAGKLRKRKLFGVIPMPVAATIGAIVAFGGAAIAALSIQTNEATAKVEAGSAVVLKLSNATPVDGKKLIPGGSVALQFDVENPNDFPVTLSDVVSTSNPTITCANSAEVALLSSSLLAGNKLVLPAPIELSAGQSKTVTVANAVSLKKAATAGCSIEGKFKLTGTGAGTGE